jgi:hypothetical protein
MRAVRSLPVTYPRRPALLVPAPSSTRAPGIFTQPSMDNFEEFLTERNAFLSKEDPTPEFVRAFFRKWNPGARQPQHDLSVMGGYYKARLGWEHCPPDKRQEAIDWLTAHGFSLET